MSDKDPGMVGHITPFPGNKTISIAADIFAGDPSGGLARGSMRTRVAFHICIWVAVFVLVPVLEQVVLLCSWILKCGVTVSFKAFVLEIFQIDSYHLAVEFVPSSPFLEVSEQASNIPVRPTKVVFNIGPGDKAIWKLSSQIVLLQDAADDMPLWAFISPANSRVSPASPLRLATLMLDLPRHCLTLATRPPGSLHLSQQQ